MRLVDNVIEISPYEGSLDDLQAFITAVWRNEYQGRMAFPIWTPEYFDWQFAASSTDPPLLIVARNEGRMVGALLGVRYAMQIGGALRRGLLSSWLSVDSAYRGQGLGTQLKEQQIQEFRDGGGDLILSYRYVGSRVSRAPRPTAAQSNDPSWSSRRVGFWARALDPRRLARWTLNPLDAFLARAGSFMVFAPRIKRSHMEIRDYDRSDLPGCQALLGRSADRFPLAINWTGDLLGRQLSGGGVGTSLVACQADEIHGLISFHVLPFSAKCVEPVAIIDLVVIDELSLRDQQALINAALLRMQDNGAMLALKLRTGDVPARSMMMTEFLWRPTDSYQMCHSLRDSDHAAIRGRQRCLWR